MSYACAITCNLVVGIVVSRLLSEWNMTNLYLFPLLYCTTNYKMERVSVDELIIHFVQDNTCLYDKNNNDFKDATKKKSIWKEISKNFKDIHGIDIDANAVEKRWSCLRDQFSRENRKKKSLSSGSANVKEWELYRMMMFLLPHIAHRRKTLFSSTSLPKPGTSTQQLSVKVHNTDVDDDVEGLHSVLEQCGPELLEGTNPIDDGTASSCSRCSSCSREPLNPPVRKMRKIEPEHDDFAKRKTVRHDSVDRELAQASQSISAAVNIMAEYMQQHKVQVPNRSGYILAIEEGLKHVPDKNKTQCLIEVLQIINKYEDRS